MEVSPFSFRIGSLVCPFGNLSKYSSAADLSYFYGESLGVRSSPDTDDVYPSKAKALPTLLFHLVSLYIHRTA